MGPQHAAVGASAGLLYAAATGQPLWAWPICAGLASATSAGHTSPDMDQSAWWRLIDRWTPDEAASELCGMGRGGPMQHRGITHWPGLPVIAGLVLLARDVPAEWALWALLVGWVSHLVADAVFGAAGAGRAAGIPLLGWVGHVGVGLKCDGILAGIVGALILPATLGALAWWLAGGQPGAVELVAAVTGRTG